MSTFNCEHCGRPVARVEERTITSRNSAKKGVKLGRSYWADVFVPLFNWRDCGPCVRREWPTKLMRYELECWQRYREHFSQETET